MESVQTSTSSSVCREFYDNFAEGRNRRPEELVAFLMGHHSSRAKIGDWIQTEEKKQKISPRRSFSESVHGDYACSSKSARMKTPPPPAETTQARPQKYSKCNLTSSTERELGNERFKQKDLLGSLLHYSQAIQYAKFPNYHNSDDSFAGGSSVDDDNNLAIALANRSAVYYELGTSYYDCALKDAELALAYNYPERLKAKLLCRKASIYVQRRRPELARECLEMIKKDAGVKHSGTPSVNNDSLKSISDIGLSKVEAYQKEFNLPPNVANKVVEIEMQIERLKVTKLVNHEDEDIVNTGTHSHKWNDDFENASQDITLRTSNSGIGRHVIASENLKKGYSLFTEDPFASVLLPEFYDSHCHHCHKPLRGGYSFPCRRCTQVKFCDDACSKAAEAYHNHECMWLDLMHSVGIAHLAIRIVLVAGVDTVLKSVDNHSVLTNLSNLDVFRKGQNNYFRVYSLLDHIPETFEEDLFQYTLTASLLTQFLILKTTFLEGVSEAQQFNVGGAILRHVCQLICNAHAITDVLPEEDGSKTPVIVEESQQRIATAIYPAASMMNHSCDPNISFQFKDGKTLIVQASRNISRGSNVYNCYGPHFRRMPRDERQEILLQQYFFNCDCDKCTLEQKSGYSFANQFQSFKCDKCEGPVLCPEPENAESILPCPICGYVQNMEMKYKMWNASYAMLKKGELLMETESNLQEAIKILESCYSSALKLLFRYNSNIGQISDSLGRCFVATGQFPEAVKVLERSLEYVEMRFGKDSVEYAREFKKFEEVSNKVES